MVDPRSVRQAQTIFAALLLVLLPSRARAEPTSWLAIGTGLSFDYDYASHGEAGALAVAAEVGVGTDPSHPLVVGGVFRALTNLGIGADPLPLSLAARLATSGFVRGEWGVAVDLGVTARLWGSQAFGHFPFQPVGILGFPGGPQLEVGALLGDVTGTSPAAAGGFVLFSIDFFRLATRASGSQKGFWSDRSAPPVTTTIHDHPPAP